jgi:hypothetical protein
MNMTQSTDTNFYSSTGATSRFGFHYFPDTLHYSDRDLQIWLPLLKEIQVGWVVLQSETRRAIPENFITGLVKAHVMPIVQFNAALNRAQRIEDTESLVDAYGRWGVRYLQIFDRPNLRSSWSAGNWAQQDLVERFLDRWLPFANQFINANISPVFPALEPGGNFWDTAFLRAALQSLERRKQTAVLEKMVLSAYAWTSNHPLTAGGPERWPEARAYFTPPQSEDQRGFCIFDWYRAVASAELGRSLPIILLQTGLPSHPDSIAPDSLTDEEYITNNRAILDAIKPSGMQSPVELPSNTSYPLISSEVIACNFWLLASDEKSPYKTHAWFAHRKPILPHAIEIAKDVAPCEPDLTFTPPIVKDDFFLKVNHPIKHYLLLPAGDLAYLGRWFTRLLPYIQQTNPTVGFSLDEAALAIRVTVAGDERYFAEDSLQSLRNKGCLVQRIGENGTSIAM